VAKSESTELTSNPILGRRLPSILGEKTAKAFSDGFDISTLGELLGHFPRRYAKRGELSAISALIEGEEATVLAQISQVKMRRSGGKTILEAVITDGHDALSLTFFNQAWREKSLPIGARGLFAGKLSTFNGKRQLAHPDYEILKEEGDSDFAGKLIPIYPATAKLPSWKIAQSIHLALAQLSSEAVPEFLDPMAPNFEKNWPDYLAAINQIHLPSDEQSLELAQARFKYEEALLLQLALVWRRREYERSGNCWTGEQRGDLAARFSSLLPFELTTGQRQVIAEISDDLIGDLPMQRLLQGEVGSGKTVVALAAALQVIDRGGQVALLAPTEVLATQHFQGISKLLGALGRAGELGAGDGAIGISLLKGSMSAPAKRKVLSDLASGASSLIIGTHALISDAVTFSNLGLVIVDEQHRFGVEQRAKLRAKGARTPHLLVMTATPIPRTIAITIFGDLDISTLRELPGGRAPITSHVIAAASKPAFLDRAWARIKEEVAAGRQAYVVAPRISATASEESASGEKLTGDELELAIALGMIGPDAGSISSTGANNGHELASIEELMTHLPSKELAGVRVAALHGLMEDEVKARVMADFAAGLINVLIATTVIEVGVDVPNATVMLILDADRFGISQLHQLRGRVGRGAHGGLCLLVSHTELASNSMLRLNQVAETQDGFALAELDLQMRQEGDVLGKMQSGARSALRLLRVMQDESLILAARADAQWLLDNDPQLNLKEHRQLSEKLRLLQANSQTDYAERD
jgi:ATP-dependent DNA helicase RecG